MGYKWVLYERSADVNRLVYDLRHQMICFQKTNLKNNYIAHINNTIDTPKNIKNFHRHNLILTNTEWRKHRVDLFIFQKPKLNS